MCLGEGVGFSGGADNEACSMCESWEFFEAISVKREVIGDIGKFWKFGSVNNVMRGGGFRRRYYWGRRGEFWLLVCFDG